MQPAPLRALCLKMQAHYATRANDVATEQNNIVQKIKEVCNEFIYNVHKLYSIHFLLFINCLCISSYIKHILSVIVILVFSLVTLYRIIIIEPLIFLESQIMVLNII